LCDLLGIDRAWPELFDALCVIASEDAEAVAKAREVAERKHRQQEAVAAARRRHG
jgi:hypothetical protein